MKFLVEETKDGQKIYDTMLVENPKALAVFSNELSLKIIQELAEIPSCAMDVARRLKQHEHKIYYHRITIYYIRNSEL